MTDADAKLVEACIAGERPAFEALYGRHAARVKAYFLRSGFAQADSDDLSQDVFVRVHRSMDTFDADRGNFRTWLSAIARNVARRQWSRRPRPDNFDPEIAEDVLAIKGDSDASPELREQVEILRGCISALPKDLSAVVRLRYVEGRTTRGISAFTGLPESTVRVRLRQASENLESCLKKKGAISP